ncbi:response regulator [Cohnella abietis]|uniref:DNA-binding response regulator n=1 Tax=Cohnella abietis TaxID=2507935 RepID=A0A3T1DBI5_9BACL|nr:response regulator [Cohnella abietis]BBI35325.1 DNA-binding response regulator [Cohnella abietis]
MYKLILVDDEADVREGVLREIDWEANGFQVSDVAENGREALEMIEKSAPDVVVTDIRMPFMDGLQLSEQIRRTYPSTKIIILTGFDEFEYARKAIHLNIEEFVLKPFSAGDLLQALHKVKGRLDEEMSERENVDSLQEHYRRSIPVLRELFLVSLMTRRLSSIEIREKTEHYGMILEGRHYTVSIMQLDNPTLERVSDDSNRSRFDYELQSFAVRNIAEEIVARQGMSGYVFQHNDNVVLLETSLETDLNVVHKNTSDLLEEIRLNVEKYIKRSVTIGIGTVTPKLSDVKYSYADASAALDYRILLGNNRIIAIEDVESRSAAPIRFDELQEQAFLRCLKVGSPEEMESVVENLFAPLILAGSSCSFRDAQIFLLQIVTTMLKALQGQGPTRQPSDRSGNDANWFREITQFDSLKEAKAWVILTCASIISRIASDRQSAYHSLVEQARTFTKAQYADSDMTIARVCAHLHISSGYFSNIFKRETKMTYVNYLLHIRMEAAKEMLLTTDRKTFEIAELVGYADPNYFSFSFKKQVGMSPKDYRNRARGELP